MIQNFCVFRKAYERGIGSQSQTILAKNYAYIRTFEDLIFRVWRFFLFWVIRNDPLGTVNASSSSIYHSYRKIWCSVRLFGITCTNVLFPSNVLIHTSLRIARITCREYVHREYSYFKSVRSPSSLDFLVCVSNADEWSNHGDLQIQYFIIFVILMWLKLSQN